jgi:hypothetical protein
MDILSNSYFWISVLTNTTWSYLRTYPYLITQLNPELFGDDWYDKGESVRQTEEEYINLWRSPIKIIIKIPGYSPLFFIFLLYPKIGLFGFILSLLFGYLLAFIIWRFMFKTNVIEAKKYLIYLWWGVVIYYLLSLLFPELLNGWT